MSDPNIVAPPAKRGFPRLMKWLKAFIAIGAGIVGLVKIISMFLPASLPECDASNVRTTITDIFREKAKVAIAAMDGFTPGAKTADNLACSVNLTFSDKTRGRLSYRVYIKDGRVMVETIETKAL